MSEYCETCHRLIEWDGHTESSHLKEEKAELRERLARSRMAFDQRKEIDRQEIEKLKAENEVLEKGIIKWVENYSTIYSDCHRLETRNMDLEMMIDNLRATLEDHRRGDA